MDRVRWCLEAECHHVEARQQARSHFTNLHLDEMTAVITQPDLLERRSRFDFKVVIDAN
jgi:hypothetical protein